MDMMEEAGSLDIRSPSPRSSTAGCTGDTPHQSNSPAAPDIVDQKLGERWRALLYSRQIALMNLGMERQRLMSLIPACRSAQEISIIQTKMHEMNYHFGNMIQRYDLELSSIQKILNVKEQPIPSTQPLPENQSLLGYPVIAQTNIHQSFSLPEHSPQNNKVADDHDDTESDKDSKLNLPIELDDSDDSNSSFSEPNCFHDGRKSSDLLPEINPANEDDLVSHTATGPKSGPVPAEISPQKESKQQIPNFQNQPHIGQPIMSPGLMGFQVPQNPPFHIVQPVMTSNMFRHPVPAFMQYPAPASLLGQPLQRAETAQHKPACGTADMSENLCMPVKEDDSGESDSLFSEPNSIHDGRTSPDLLPEGASENEEIKMVADDSVAHTTPGPKDSPFPSEIQPKKVLEQRIPKSQNQPYIGQPIITPGLMGYPVPQSLPVHIVHPVMTPVPAYRQFPAPMAFLRQPLQKTETVVTNASCHACGTDASASLTLHAEVDDSDTAITNAACVTDTSAHLTLHDEVDDSDDNISLFSESTCEGDEMALADDGTAAKKKRKRKGNKKKSNKPQDSQIQEDSSDVKKTTLEAAECQRRAERDKTQVRQLGPSSKGSNQQSTKITVKDKEIRGAKTQKGKPTETASSVWGAKGGAVTEYKRLQSEEYPDLQGAASISKRDVKKIENTKTAKEKLSSAPPEPQKYMYASSKMSQKMKKMTIPTMSLSRMASVNTINDEASLYINSAAEKGMLVTVHGAVEHILARFGVNSLGELGINRITDISCLKKLSFVLSRVSAYLNAYSAFQSIGTMYDLGKDLAKDCEKTDFEELHLGPLAKQPKVKELFSFPQDVEKVPHIRVTDIMIQLKKYMEEHKASNQKIDLKKFLEYLQEQYTVSSPWELGIRIQSIGLAISVIKKVRRNQYDEMDKAREKLIFDLTTQFEKETKKIRTQLEHSMGLQKDPSLLSVTMTTRKKYADMDSTDVVLDVFQSCEDVFSRSSSRVLKDISNFLTRLLSDQLARKMFQYALVCGKLEKPEDLVRKRPVAENRAEDAEKQEKPRPSHAQLLKKLKELLGKCRGLFNLETLTRIESRIPADLGFEHFTDLGQGSFLDFLKQNQKILEDYGLTAFSLAGINGKSSVSASRQDILAFIQQFAYSQYGQPQMKAVASALCHHYKVKDVKDLGHGSLEKLVESLSREAKHNVTDLSLCYASPLISLKKLTSANSHPTVGLLSAQSKEKALLCLSKAPLLTDLQQWSQWKLIFEPQHGPLKQFLIKYGAYGSTNGLIESEDLVAIETEPGSLIRITRVTGPEHFLSSAQNKDPVYTAGHVVSIIAKSGGVDQAPLKLLANHMNAALAESSQSVTREQVANFVLLSLLAVPPVLRPEVAREVFLEPLAKYLMCKPYELLCEVCSSAQQEHELINLGLQMGVEEWMRIYQDRLMPTVTEHQELDYQDVIIDDDLSAEEEEDEVSRQEALIDEALGVSCDFELRSPAETEENRTENQMPATDNASVSPDKENEDDSVHSGEEKPTNLPSGENMEPVTADTAVVPSVIDHEQQESAVDETEDMTETPDPCEQLIETIRKTRFGIGMELSEEAQLLTNELKDVIGRSLKTLSSELYNKDTHFVLELIQNADDNEYPTQQWEEKRCQEQPALVFMVETDCITLVNNECGFRENHIRALCDVNKTTKGKHKQGYIGQKGIGFKSVFTVTDQPEIHSNGYHFCFDAKSGPTGYILPHWSKSGKRPIKTTGVKNLDFEDDRWTTMITLPLKDQTEMDKHRSRSLTSSFQDVHPSLLLFLHRLKSITVINKVKNENLVIKRTDVENNMVEIKHGNKVDRWLVVRMSLSVSEQLSPDVASTELALAFPLAEKGKMFTTKYPKLPVFAYLPLRNFGFNFIVQGDFEIPTSRQDVKDTLWNQWLRSEIPALFVQAFDDFKKCPHFSDVLATSSFLSFVPLDGEICDFFQPVAKDILHLLAGQNIFPVKTTGSSCEWRKPSEVVICRDDLVRDLITPDLLHRHLNLHYLLDDIRDSVNETLLHSLGVQSLRAEHVVQVFKAYIQTDNQGMCVSVKNIAKWLACVHRCLDDMYGDDQDDVREQLKLWPIIPLSTGKFVALKDSPTFFPLQKKTLASKSSSVGVLQDDYNTVHPELFSSTDDLASSQIRHLLIDLGVKTLTRQDLIREHIFPVLESKQWDEKSKEVRIAYLMCIQEEWKENAHRIDLEKLRRVVRVLTNQGFVNPSENPVHFSMNYLNTFDLIKYFEGYEWCIVDKCYLSACSSKDDVLSWRNFFESLGVVDFLAVQKETRELTRSQLSSSEWSSLSSLLPATVTSVQIENYTCTEFEGLVTSSVPDGVKFVVMQNVFRCLSALWEQNYEKYRHCSVTWTDCASPKQFDSTFYRLLRESTWIPSIYTTTTRGQTDRNSFGKIDHQKLKKPCEVYLREKSVEELLSFHVTYLTVEISTQTNLPLDIGMRVKLGLDELVEMLKSWSTCATDETQEKPKFCTTLSHMKKVYKHLLMHHENVKQLLADNDLFFLPFGDTARDSKGDDNMIREGSFYKLSELCWRDETGLFAVHKPTFVRPDGESYRRMQLEPFYRDMKEFFMEIIGISKSPNMTEYVMLLCKLCQDTRLPDRAAVQDVFRIYSVLGEKCIAPDPASQMYQRQDSSLDEKLVDLVDSYVGTLRAVLKNEPVFPTTSNRWVTLADVPLIIDDKSLAALFEDKHQDAVNFLDADSTEGQVHVGGQNQTDMEKLIRIFFHALNIRKLTEELEVECIEENTRPSPLLQGYMHDVVPFIQRFMKSRRSFQHLYRQLNKDKIYDDLNLLTFFQVGKLEVVYRLKYKPELNVTITEKIKLKREDHQMYIHKDSLESHYDINKEICKLFVPAEKTELSKELFMFLSALKQFLKDGSPSTERDFVDMYCLAEVPDSEKKWSVRAPQVYASQISYGEPHMSLPSDINWTAEDEAKIKQGNTDGAATCWPPLQPRKGGSYDQSSNKEPVTKESLLEIWPRPEQQEDEAIVVQSDAQCEAKHDYQSSESIPGEVGNNRPSRSYHSQTSAEARAERAQQSLSDENTEAQRSLSTENTNLKTQSNKDPNPVKMSEKEAQHSTAYEHKERPSNPSQVVTIETAPRHQHSTSKTSFGSKAGASSLANILRPVEFLTGIAIEDIVCEDIGDVHKHIAVSGITLTPAAAGSDEIGRWGEEWVYKYLQHRFCEELESDQVKITWFNEDEESASPYDIMFQIVCPDSNPEVHYIEVKTTKTEDKEMFEISLQQILMVCDKKQFYHIYRVYNAGGAADKVKLKILRNVTQLMDGKVVQLCMFL